MSEVLKVPLFVEIIGEPESGKTHLSCLFPKPALFDTTAKGEGYVVLKKVCPEDWKKRYFRIRAYDEFDKQLKIVKQQKAIFRTVIVDTSVELRAQGGEAHLKELNKVKPRFSLMPEEWGAVNALIDTFIYTITNPADMGMNLVFTSQMQDEWADRKPTGRRIRKGYPNANFQSDIRLFLEIKQQVDQSTMQYIDKYERTCRVVKNRFRDRVNPNEWIPFLKEFSWKGILGLTNLEAGEVVE